MAWKVALVVDIEYSPRDLERLVHQMPVWAVRTDERTPAAPLIRDGAGELWSPEPAYTLFPPVSTSDREETCSHVIGTMLEHHPHLAALELIGISTSPRLKESLQDEGFVPASGRSYVGLPFRKPVETLANVQELVLEAAGWNSANDVYDSFFYAVRAPAWHSRNFHALEDSIVTGGINEIEVPYRLVIRNFAHVPSAACELAVDFIDLIRRFETEGCPVAVRVEKE